MKRLIEIRNRMKEINETLLAIRNASLDNLKEDEIIKVAIKASILMHEACALYKESREIMMEIVLKEKN